MNDVRLSVLDSKRSLANSLGTLSVVLTLTSTVGTAVSWWVGARGNGYGDTVRTSGVPRVHPPGTKFG